MKVVKRQTTTIIMELTEEEAMWLHIQMQNPLHYMSPDDEDLRDKEMRKVFFEATS